MMPRQPPILAVVLVTALLGWVLLGPTAGAAPPAPALTLPITDAQIVSLARIPEPNWLPGHRGVDIAADARAIVLAPGAGRVDFAGPVGGRPVVAIEIDIGLRATLEPVIATVAVGVHVGRGDAVGIVADATGHCGARSCVHWGLKHRGRYVDPLDWLEGYGRIVLLPHSASRRKRPSTAGSPAAS